MSGLEYIITCFAKLKKQWDVYNGMYITKNMAQTSNAIQVHVMQFDRNLTR